MRMLLFPSVTLLFFLGWVAIYLGLDAASENLLLPVLSVGWQLLILFALHIASAAGLAYGYSRAVDGAAVFSVRRVLLRFAVLVLAALASVAVLLLLAIAVFSPRG
jgi:hypothetical protein